MFVFTNTIEPNYQFTPGDHQAARTGHVFQTPRIRTHPYHVLKSFFFLQDHHEYVEEEEKQADHPQEYTREPSGDCQDSGV